MLTTQPQEATAKGLHDWDQSDGYCKKQSPQQVNLRMWLNSSYQQGLLLTAGSMLSSFLSLSPWSKNSAATSSAIWNRQQTECHSSKPRLWMKVMESSKPVVSGTSVARKQRETEIRPAFALPIQLQSGDPLERSRKWHVSVLPNHTKTVPIRKNEQHAIY